MYKAYLVLSKKLVLIPDINEKEREIHPFSSGFSNIAGTRNKHVGLLQIKTNILFLKRGWNISEKLFKKVKSPACKSLT